MTISFARADLAFIACLTYGGTLTYARRTNDGAWFKREQDARSGTAWEACADPMVNGGIPAVNGLHGSHAFRTRDAWRLRLPLTASFADIQRAEIAKSERHAEMRRAERMTENSEAISALTAKIAKIEAGIARAEARGDAEFVEEFSAELDALRAKLAKLT